MDKKLISICCAIISMVAVAIFLFWGFLGDAWNVAWLVFVVSGIACAAVSMIGGYLSEKKETEGKTKKKSSK